MVAFGWAVLLSVAVGACPSVPYESSTVQLFTDVRSVGVGHETRPGRDEKTPPLHVGNYC